MDRLLASLAGHELDVGQEVVGDEEVDRVCEVADALRDVAGEKLRTVSASERGSLRTCESNSLPERAKG